MTAPATPGGRADLTLRCADNPSAGVKFHNRFRYDEDAVHYAVEVWAPGLTARVHDVVAWIWDGDLAPFLEGLAADFRGWEGARNWRNHDGDLSVSAVFRSGGHAGLTWTVRPWPAVAGGWTASVTTWVEAGEQLSAFAADARRFLTG